MKLKILICLIILGFVFVPGKVKKTEFAKKLSSVFDSPVDEIMKILPPGDLDIHGAEGIEIDN